MYTINSLLPPQAAIRTQTEPLGSPAATTQSRAPASTAVAVLGDSPEAQPAVWGLQRRRNAVRQSWPRPAAPGAHAPGAQQSQQAPKSYLAPPAAPARWPQVTDVCLAIAAYLDAPAELESFANALGRPAAGFWSCRDNGKFTRLLQACGGAALPGADAAVRFATLEPSRFLGHMNLEDAGLAELARNSLSLGPFAQALQQEANSCLAARLRSTLQRCWEVAHKSQALAEYGLEQPARGAAAATCSLLRAELDQLAQPAARLSTLSDEDARQSVAELQSAWASIGEPPAPDQAADRLQQQALRIDWLQRCSAACSKMLDAVFALEGKLEVTVDRQQLCTAGYTFVR